LFEKEEREEEGEGRYKKRVKRGKIKEHFYE
jgi:hypothetical protein